MHQDSFFSWLRQEPAWIDTLAVRLCTEKQQVRGSHPSLPIVMQLIDKAGESALRVLITQCKILVIIHVLYICQKGLQRNFILDVISYNLLTILHTVIAIPAYPAPAALSPDRKGLLQRLQNRLFLRMRPVLAGLHASTDADMQIAETK